MRNIRIRSQKCNVLKFLYKPTLSFTFNWNFHSGHNSKSVLTVLCYIHAQQTILNVFKYLYIFLLFEVKMLLLKEYNVS